MEDKITAKIFEPTNERRYVYIEFFRNGEAWSKGNKLMHDHFIFGREKAKMVIECWDLIEEYVNTDGSMPVAGDPNNFRIYPSNWGGYFKVIKEPEFDRNGQIIDKNYLHFKHGDYSWGFGLTKAKAVLQFKEMLQELADRE